MANSVSSILLAALLLIPIPSAFAQNLLPNTDFNDNLSGWNSNTGQSWSDDDSDGVALSGSVRIELTELGSTAISVCVPVSAGRVYDFGADVKLDIAQNSDGRAGVVVHWTSDNLCEDDLPGFPSNISLTFAEDWQTVASTAVAPSFAVAALFELRASKTAGSGGGRVAANLDDAFLSRATACADPAPPFDDVTAADALFVLRSSVGTLFCDRCVCDTNSSGEVAASDALTVLRFSVELETELNCPPCS